MKKLIILMTAVALVCFGVPAMAVDWNFYGSARIQTFWNSTDNGDSGSEEFGMNPTDGDEDAELQWKWSSGSRIGATVKAENEYRISHSSCSSWNRQGCYFDFILSTGFVRKGKNITITCYVFPFLMTFGNSLTASQDILFVGFPSNQVLVA